MRAIGSTVEIAAAPEAVWRILTDFAGFASWNPFITSASGEARVGTRLDIMIAPPGGKAMRFRPTVLVADPARELRWRGRLLFAGLFDGEHRFELERHGSGTRLLQAEDFSGLLVPLMPASAYERTERGFAAMNQALRARAEAGTN